MAEKRGSQERLRFYLRALIGFMVLLGAAGLVYLYLAFAPTGYREFVAENAASLEQAQAALDRIAPSTGDDGHTTGALPSDSGAGAAPQTEKRDLLEAIREIHAADVPWLGRSVSVFGAAEFFVLPSQFDPSSTPFGLAPGEKIRERITNQAARGIAGSRYRATVERALRHYGMSIGGQPGQGGPDNDRLEVDAYLRFLRERREGTLSGEETSQGMSAERVHSALDAMEAFLLASSWRAPDFESFPLDFFYPHSARVAQLGELAILRAAMQGDKEKAARLFGRYLRLMRALRAAAFPANECVPVSPVRYVEPVCLASGEFGAVPADALKQADQALVEDRIGPEKLEALCKAHAARIPRQYALSFEAWRNEWLRSNRANSVVGLLSRPALPLYERLVRWQSERVAMEWYRDEETRGWKAFDRLRLCQHLGDEIFGGPGWEGPRYILPRRWWPPDPGWEATINEDIDFCRFVLAAVRYRLDHGRHPESVEEFAPAFLEEEFFESPDTGWALLPFEKAPCAILWAVPYTLHVALPGKEGFHPVILTLRQFWADHHRLPTTAEEVRPYAADESVVDAFRDLIQPLEARPLFCRFRRAKLERWQWGQLEYFFTFGQPPQEKEEADRHFAQGAETINVIQVTAHFPVYPLISEELLEILKQREGPIQ